MNTPFTVSITCSPPSLSNRVNHLNNRAIQRAQQTIGRILRQFELTGGGEPNQALMSRSNLLDTRSRCKVQAKAH